MGSAVSIEIDKPINAEEIRATGSLNVASSEVIRLRSTLGHLAKQAGFTAVIYDASDIVLGVNDSEDFERCCAEIAHIRHCLKLSTLNSKRQARQYDTKIDADDNNDDNDSDSSDSD